MFKKIKEMIEKYNTIIIERHARPDGDALGSQIGLREALLETYPEKKVYAVGDCNGRYSFIGKLDLIDPSIYEGALVFVLDSAEPKLLFKETYKLGEFVIKIDHHISVCDFGDLNYVDTTYESCAGIITELIKDLGFKINQEGAKALFTGMVTDSGRFRYEQTTPRTFKNAAWLLETGFKLDDIYLNLYIEELDIVKLKAKLINSFKVSKNKVAYLKNTARDVIKYGVDVYTLSRGMVNVMAGIKGIDIWVNFTEDVENNRILCELRSSKFNINKIAVKYGGGGHRLASGASLNSFEEADKMLEDLDLLALEDCNE